MLRAIALASLLAAPGLAQDGGSDRPSGECTPSREPHECAERCPSFDTCFVAAGDGQLYYEVGDQRFDCVGLECAAANQSLSDYCCRRGELAPPPSGGDDDGDGGGCALTSSGAVSSNGHLGMLGGLWAGLLGLAARRRRIVE